MKSEISPALQTIFSDLAEQVRTSPPAGSVYTRERDGISYHYAKIPVGVERIDTFIGKVGDPAAEAQADSLKRGMSLAQGRRRIVSMLRSGGFAVPDRTLGATLDAIAHAGLFRDGAVLVGTGAYMTSEALVGHFLPAPTLMTGDLDLATASLALSAERPERLDAILKRGDPSFQPVMQLDPRRPASRFQTRAGFFVDLVTPTRRRDDSNPVPLKALSAGAAPLHHIDWLIADPFPTIALWGAGVTINVPQPARLAVHKLILAQRRNRANSTKRSKDLAQADALMAALSVHDPFALEDALDDARARGRKGWSDLIDRSLKEIEAINRRARQ